MSKLLFASSTVGDGNMASLYGTKTQALKNRDNFFKRVGVYEQNFVAMWLTGRDDVATVSPKNRGETIQADALITNTPDLALFMTSADCFPVTIFDSVKNVVALVHLGRSGIDKKLVQKVVKTMDKEFNSQAVDFKVVIGPGIRKGSYIYDKIPEQNNPEWQQYLYKLSDGNISIDLTGYLVDQLLQVGISKENIQDDGVDTFQEENYFSHRRSFVTGELEGRFATVVMLT